MHIGAIILTILGDNNTNILSIIQRKTKVNFYCRCFFPEPQKGGNSNTGNVATRLFQ